MPLVRATDEHLVELMGWFPDRESCAVWGGPRIRYPFTVETFREDTRWDEVPTLSLTGAAGELLANGQYYERAGRCHLARLAVSPGRRGEGLGGRLVRELAAVGCPALGTAECSLWVLEHNTPARRLYEKLGFRPAEAGEPPPIEGCRFLTAPLAVLVDG